jgi:hypothetical protein
VGSFLLAGTLLGRSGSRADFFALAFLENEKGDILHYPIQHVPFLKSGTTYTELGADFLDGLEPERLTRRLVHRLEKLGHKVTLEPVSAAQDVIFKAAVCRRVTYGIERVRGLVGKGV